MSDMLKAIEFLGIPMTTAIVLIGLFLIMQIIGELLEFKGKVVPEFIKVRKYFQRKRDEKEKQRALLEQVQISLDEINRHYSNDNIAKRNNWMNWVNSRAQVYDAAIADLTSLKTSIEANNDLTLELYINFNRNRIIDFASKVVNENILISREEFNRIFKVYNEYEEILEKHGKTNGEVDIAYDIITEAYEQHMKNHSFIEDVRLSK